MVVKVKDYFWVQYLIHFLFPECQTFTACRDSTFFYRERQWYAGQYIRKIKAKFELNKYTALYFETVFNSLSQNLLSGLVMDVNQAFLSSTIMLPVNNKDKIDFLWIEQFVKQQKAYLLDRVISFYRNELGDKLESI